MNPGSFVLSSSFGDQGHALFWAGAEVIAEFREGLFLQVIGEGL
jgi:hypothetical protein